MPTPIQNIPVKTIAGVDASLADYAGKVLLIVNVASKCGLTPQYEGLEKIYAQYRDAGLVVMGFPANDFGAQEPGADAEIATFCTTNFGVDFPMFSKVVVTGDGIHPLYRELTNADVAVNGDSDGFREKLKGYGVSPNPAPGILWNFEKFVIGRGGNVVARFDPSTAPDDPALIATLEAELGK